MAATYMAGYVVSLPKSRLCPSQVLQLLGFIVDSAEQQYRIPEAKMADILKRLRTLRAHTDAMGKPRDRTQAPLREMQSIIGKLQALQLAVPGISVFLQSSFKEIKEAVRRNAMHVRVTTNMLHDYQDLLSLESWTPMSRWRSEEHLVVRMDTDASGHGWGGCLWTPEGAHTAKGLFKGAGQHDPIHVKEAWAVVYTLREVGGFIRDCELDLYTDNEIVRFTLMRGAGDYAAMREIAKELFQWQLTCNVRVNIHRVTTEDNLVADSLSRTGEVTPVRFTQFRLRLDKFRLLQSWMPVKFTLDLCASKGNNLLPRFVAPNGEGEPGCIATNAFTCNLREDPVEFLYCYPPWAIISPLLRHLKLSKARGVMLVPADPTKQWYGPAIHGKAPGVLARKGDMTTVYQVAEDGSEIAVKLQHDMLVITLGVSPEAAPSALAAPLWRRR
jgi:hypothetical protein